MKKTLIIQLILLSLSIIISCSSKNSSNELEKQTTEETPKGYTTISGVVVSIDSTKLSNDQNSPCSKVPCWASIKVTNVLGQGQGGPLIAPGDTLDVRFAFTLSKTTEDLIPHLDKRLPGLTLNDNFEANLKYLMNTNSQTLYEVYHYSKK